MFDDMGSAGTPTGTPGRGTAVLDGIAPDDLDGTALADAVVETRHHLCEVEAAEVSLVLAWAERHNPDTLVDDPTGPARRRGRRLRGREQAKIYAGHGTPAVTEFAAAELGPLLGISTIAAVRVLTDALNLTHRHPLLHTALNQRSCRRWQADQVTRMCQAADLSLEQARWVDAATTPYIGSLPWPRFTDLVAAKIIEADPAGANARAKAAAAEQFVATGQCNQHGLKTLIAKAAAGDIIYFTATCDRIAGILALQGDTDPIGVRRAKAIGILAIPARAYALLQRYATTDNHDPNQDPAHGADPGTDPAPVSGTGVITGFADRRIDPREPTTDQHNQPDRHGQSDHCEPSEETDQIDQTDGADVLEELAELDGRDQVGPADLHPADNDADDTTDAAPDTHPCPTCHGDGAVAGDPQVFIRPIRVDPKKLLPDATLYVHMSLQAFLDHTHPTGTTDPSGPSAARRVRAERDAVGHGHVARVENRIGPLTLDQAIGLLGHSHVTIKPVIDLTQLKPVDCYETPDAMREAIRLLRPASVFPHSGNRGASMDLDHPIPYRPQNKGGPPGQTDPYAMAPLHRYEHRVKTHGRGWRMHNPHPGVYLWRTRHGHWYQVDPTGTHHLGRNPDLDKWSPKNERSERLEGLDRSEQRHTDTPSRSDLHARLTALHPPLTTAGLPQRSPAEEHLAALLRSS